MRGFCSSVAVICVLFSLSILFSDTVKASNHKNFVGCVQKQLEFLGYVSSFKMGNIDQDTIEGFARLRDRKTDVKLPNLERKTAATICRQLGLENFRLRKFWQSAPRPVLFDFSDGISERSRNLVRDAAIETQRRLNIRLVEQKIIVAADSKKELFDLRDKYKPESINFEVFSEIYDNTCSKTNEYFGGIAFENLIMLCLIADEEPGSYEYVFDLKATIIHEYIHAVQYELTGRPDFKTGLSIDLWGPYWLLEGTAQFFTISSLFPVDEWGSYYTSLKTRIGEPWNDIEGYESDIFPVEVTTDLYNKGHYAAYYLASKYGYSALLKFYEDIGLGLDWKHSFANNFGMSSNEFYESYQSMD